ncbi:MAG: alkaline phosphatase family protein [Bacteroidota bacterium]
MKIFNKNFFLMLIFQFGLIQLLSAQQNYQKKAGTFPKPDRIVILIYENHSYNSIVGAAAASHINNLINDTANTALFTQSFGIEHPSQPNYIDLFSGGNQGVTNDNVPTGTPYSTPNLARQLIDSGKTFATYSEDMPSVGYNGASSGYYARKHNPVANWMGTGINQVPTTTNLPFTSFPTSNFFQLPTVSFVVPNLVNDMHNGTDPTAIQNGDSWLLNYMNPFLTWAMNNNSLFILTFDEDDNSSSNKITTLFYGPMVKGGKYSNTINHYSILRLIEDIYNLPYAGAAAGAGVIDYCWKSKVNTGIYENVKGDCKLVVNPNPASSVLEFTCNKIFYEPVDVIITDAVGKQVGSYQIVNSNKLSINTSSLKPGMYFYKIVSENNVMHSGRFVINQH